MILALPFCEKDAHLALKNLALCAVMEPKELPIPRTCLLTFDNVTPPDAVLDAAKKVFADVRLFEYEEWRGTPDWPQPQNWAFQSTARHVAEMQGEGEMPWFWWEQDAVPLHPKWIKQIEDAYTAGGKPFMGHIVQGMGHMNGVAVYPKKIADYSVNSMICRAAAWDVVLKNDCQRITTKANDVFFHAWNLHEGKPNNQLGSAPSFKNKAEVLATVDIGKFAIFHRCKDGTLHDILNDLWK